MNPQDAEKLLLALVSAYVWVASADETGVDLDEYHKFEKAIIRSPFATHFGAENIRHTFKDMVALFQEDFNYAIDLSRKRIGLYFSSPTQAEEIIRLARSAAVGDNQLKDVEELVISEISKELGLENK